MRFYSLVSCAVMLHSSHLKFTQGILRTNGELQVYHTYIQTHINEMKTKISNALVKQLYIYIYFRHQWHFKNLVCRETEQNLDSNNYKQKRFAGMILKF